MKIKRKMIAKTLALLGLLMAGPAYAEGSGLCHRISHEGQAYTVCEVSAEHDLRLFLKAEDGSLLGSFSRIDTELQREGKRLAFAMNAGMYHSDRSPVGLYIENGQEQAPIVTAAGPGNFGMRPNGVFCRREDGRYAVIESRAFKAELPACRFATQSGPMLVIDGTLHPRFLADSSSRYTRNGVGVSADGSQAYFVISDARVTFHQFGSFFRDALQTPQALYFDGNISRLYAPELKRNDFGFPMGPIVGLAINPN